MLGEIRKSEVVMIGIDLPSPFPLGFGKLKTLPRVFLRLTVEGETGEIFGFGEASIDFPFSHYDAWDIYNALSSLKLEGLNVLNREDILQNLIVGFVDFPAAFAALNMSLDDAYGKLTEKSVLELYGYSRIEGAILESVPFLTPDALVTKMRLISSAGRVPKVKAGESITSDVARLTEAFGLGVLFAVDFNAAYSPDQFRQLMQMLGEKVGLESTPMSIFWEQPTREDLGISALAEVHKMLFSLGYMIPIVADESFVTKSDAITCEQNDILLNYKIQKIGGIWLAKEIEKSLRSNSPAIVGGTFPTAIGRVWDQQAACILKSVQLPSDGWQPASDWFSDEKHFIQEGFQTSRGISKAFQGHGLGVTILWNKLRKFEIPNPAKEYLALRQDQSGSVLKIELVKNAKYSTTYTRLSGKDPLWNL